ncbi:MAG: gliding motility-associated C-terminal domain-containing protein, partial [Bacteroidota bacterium]
QDFVLHIFDRWGEEVFSTQDISQVWDGRFRGQGSPSGVYAYLIQYTTVEEGRQQVTGDLSLLR